jgi:hypothetical protein
MGACQTRRGRRLRGWRRGAAERSACGSSQDGAEIVNAVADRMRREMYRSIDLEKLLYPAIIG